MKDKNFFRSPLPVLILLATVLGLFSLSSYSSVDEADSQAIKELSAKVAETEVELLGLQQLNEQVGAWSQPTIGQIAMFGGNTKPNYWTQPGHPMNKKGVTHREEVEFWKPSL